MGQQRELIISFNSNLQKKLMITNRTRWIKQILLLYMLGCGVSMSSFGENLTNVGKQRLNCLMRPPAKVFKIPKQGLFKVGDGISHECEMIANDQWTRFPSTLFDLLIYTNGPGGSGRFWDVTLGIVTKGETNPIRGICLETSTIGWRTLQKFKRLPLPWLEDLDKDGNPEFILWDSFPLHEEASQAAYGLIAWIYRVDLDNGLVIDWKLSRQMASEIAAAYLQPLDPEDRLRLQSIRTRLSQALQAFSKNECSLE